MVSRSRVRMSRVLGIPLFSKIDWYLRRRHRPPGRRRRRATARAQYRLTRHDQNRLRDRYRMRGQQLQRVCAEAARRPGDLGQNLVQVLERRLDALVWRAGFARTIQHARQLIAHNRFTVDGGKVDRPAFQVSPGQTVQVNPARLGRAPAVAAMLRNAGQTTVPPYIDVQPTRLRATLTREPQPTDLPAPARIGH